MTDLRPEREGRPYQPHGEQPYPPYPQAADAHGRPDAFEAAVERLDDPLNDPLPGPAAAPLPDPYEQARPAPPAGSGAGAGSPWFRPHQPQAGPPQPPAGPRPAARHRRPDPEDTPQAADPAGTHGPDADAYGRLYGGLATGSYAPAPDRPGESIPGPYGVPEALTAPLPTISPLLPAPPAPTAAAAYPSRTDEETMALRQAGQRGPYGAPGDVSRETGAHVSRETASATDTGVSRETGSAAAVSRETSPLPATGGRAARRKAAQAAARRGGRHGRHGSRAAAPSAAAATEAPKAPLTRVEARRAQRAAKDSPGLIASRALGEVFITLGVLMLLFVTYQLWWTNVMADEEAGGAATTLQHQWESGGGEKKNLADGERFGIMYIPKLDMKAPIAEGIDKHAVLDHGMIGHYDANSGIKTAMPWDRTGNFAVAAHRNTHGEPFRYINRLTKGDKIVVETQSAYYTYEMVSVLPQTSPSNTSVIGPVPPGSGFTGPGRYITLTTCTPEFTSTFRLIVWGKMVDERPRSKGKPEALAG
ncbi:class E sortase [Streptomyces sp. RS10V-4]|uniref:class E sortase n=1 Tax=Streptomyces rhizoryzae TaxID=2932493 RepID=UPI0020030DC1|nr:class E sortase [Streptomyces rhizoryzae]MCK7623413.1 class E sortase [Streptomyces rhizoryzae]